MSMRILGVDPGLTTTGFGILEKQGNEYLAIDFGGIKFNPQEKFPIRLKKIYAEICNVIDRFQPDEFAIEEVFYADNVKVALKMGHARGVAILAAVNHRLPTFEYSAKEIKQSVVGNGGASKEQVQRMVQQLLNLPSRPEPHDAADALAVALCHLHRVESRR